LHQSLYTTSPPQKKKSFVRAGPGLFFSPIRLIEKGDEGFYLSIYFYFFEKKKTFYRFRVKNKYLPLY
jgi:hypothetical protein